MKQHIVTTVVVVAFMLLQSDMALAGPKQDAGMGIGAILGGVIGSQIGGNQGGQIAGGIIGSLAGALVGGAIGAQLDEQDRQRLDRITYQSLTTGSTRSFKSKTGVRATTKIASSSKTGGKLCRVVQQDVVLPDGRTSRDTVRGCKGPKGWSV